MSNTYRNDRTGTKADVSQHLSCVEIQVGFLWVVTSAPLSPLEIKLGFIRHMVLFFQDADRLISNGGKGDARSERTFPYPAARGRAKPGRLHDLRAPAFNHAPAAQLSATPTQPSPPWRPEKMGFVKILVKNKC